MDTLKFCIELVLAAAKAFLLAILSQILAYFACRIVNSANLILSYVPGSRLIVELCLGLIFDGIVFDESQLLLEILFGIGTLQVLWHEQYRSRPWLSPSQLSWVKTCKIITYIIAARLCYDFQIGIKAPWLPVVVLQLSWSLVVSVFQGADRFLEAAIYVAAYISRAAARDEIVVLVIHYSSTAQGPINEIAQSYADLKQMLGYVWTSSHKFAAFGHSQIKLTWSNFRRILLRQLVSEIPSNEDALLYHYGEPLPPGHIRLLKIRGGFQGIHGEMVSVSLKNRPLYEAISYRWGDEQRSHQLRLQDGVLPITKNVFGILNDIAPIFGTKYIWIDFICINQENEKDKEIQVQIMRRIYQDARKVVVWLGHESDSDTALQWVKVLYRHLRSGQFAQDRTPFPNELTSWTAFYRLLNNCYWSRAWIIQEVSLGHKVELWYGESVIGWDIFGPTISSYFSMSDGSLALTMKANPEQGLPSSGVGFITRLHNLKRRVEKGLLPLPELLVECSQSAATDPRDKVFALLGICGMVEDLRVNYDLPWPTVSRNAAIHSLSTGSFSLITTAGICSPKSRDLPSWVPDLSRPTKLYPLENPGSTYRAAKTKPVSFFSNPIHSERLYISGIFIDKIKVVAQSRPYFTMDLEQILAPGFTPDINMFLNDNERQREIYELAKEHTWEPYTKMNALQSCLEARSRTIIGDEGYSMGANGRRTRPAEDSLVNDYYLYCDALRALGEGRDPGENVKQWLQRNPSGLLRISNAMGRKICVRQFAVTEKRYMALVPDGTQQGDCVVIFMGAATPHILRAKEKYWDEDGCKGHDLVGDAYVHGLMDGQALSMGKPQMILLV